MRERISGRRTIKSIFGFKSVYAALERRCTPDGQTLRKRITPAQRAKIEFNMVHDL